MIEEHIMGTAIPTTEAVYPNVRAGVDLRNKHKPLDYLLLRRSGNNLRFFFFLCSLFSSSSSSSLA